MPKISLCAISYNEAEHLEKWYEMHKDFADEIILVDTGSYDGTQEIAKKLGIKFYEMKWGHSFAEAKNFAIRCCKHEWIINQNPDLWINPMNYDIIKSYMKKGVKGISMPTLADKEFGNLDLPLGITKEIKEKDLMRLTNCCIFRNDPNIHYRQRVHENINESIIENYGKEAIIFIPEYRYHHTPKRVYKNKAKVRYYNFLEDYGAMERKYWEHAQILRKTAYDYELSKQIPRTPRK